MRTYSTLSLRLMLAEIQYAAEQADKNNINPPQLAPTTKTALELHMAAEDICSVMMRGMRGTLRHRKFHTPVRMRLTLTVPLPRNEQIIVTNKVRSMVQDILPRNHISLLSVRSRMYLQIAWFEDDARTTIVTANKLERER